MRADAGWATRYCKQGWVIDRRGWVHTIHSALCGSLHFHTATVCLSATDNAGNCALPWACKVVICQPTASRAVYHRGDPHTRMAPRFAVTDCEILTRWKMPLKIRCMYTVEQIRVVVAFTLSIARTMLSSLQSAALKKNTLKITKRRNGFHHSFESLFPFSCRKVWRHKDYYLHLQECNGKFWQEEAKVPALFKKKQNHGNKIWSCRAP